MPQDPRRQFRSHASFMCCREIGCNIGAEKAVVDGHRIPIVAVIIFRVNTVVREMETIIYENGAEGSEIYWRARMQKVPVNALKYHEQGDRLIVQTDQGTQQNGADPLGNDVGRMRHIIERVHVRNAVMDRVETPEGWNLMLRPM